MSLDKALTQVGRLALQVSTSRPGITGRSSRASRSSRSTDFDLGTWYHWTELSSGVGCLALRRLRPRDLVSLDRSLAQVGCLALRRLRPRDLVSLDRSLAQVGRLALRSFRPRGLVSLDRALTRRWLSRIAQASPSRLGVIGQSSHAALVVRRPRTSATRQLALIACEAFPLFRSTQQHRRLQQYQQ